MRHITVLIIAFFLFTLAPAAPVAAQTNPTLAACGLPLGGYVYGTHTFNLTDDCVLTGSLIIPYESDVVINGNGHMIDGSGSAGHPLNVAGRFSLNNVVVSGSQGFTVRTHLDNVTTIKNTIFRSNSQPLVFQDSTLSLENVLTENHQQGNDNSISGIWVFGSAQLTIRDSIFREMGRLTVYRVDEGSRGHFALSVTLAQVDANGIGMVGASADGFAAVYKLKDGNVMVSVGPDGEGKAAHITLDGSVHGRVLSLTTSYGSAPAAAGVKRTKTLHGCMVRTKYMLNFRDGPAGDRITNFQDYHGMRQDWLPPFVTLTALERMAGWLKVDYHGTQGWISEDFVEQKGNCG